MNFDLPTELEASRRRYARQARLLDGASQVHKMVLACTSLADGMDFRGRP